LLEYFMSKTLRLSLIVLVLASAGGLCAYYWVIRKPAMFERQIARFEQADRLNPPRPGVIVFTGSSSIRFWDTLGKDMQPLDVLNRGFGGSQISQVNQYASRIVLPYQPRAVVLYAGDNDLAFPWLKTPEQVLADFKQFVEIIHAQLPDTWIYFISIKPSLRRWTGWEKIKKTNELIADYIRTQPRVQFIDVDSAMLDPQGKPRPDLFRKDGLHMNAQGYAIWVSIVKPVLMNRFAPGSQ
jgi:lysophospholipase L1-like esterase